MLTRRAVYGKIIVEKMAKTFVDSLKADIGVGFGLGANISDNITIGPFSLNDEMDFVVSLSASLHVLFGGHVSAGFNVTEYFERIFD